uniref:Uncharacterized protein n=1 Tax=Arundo donax TaxID=35708 RepID=A0A0A9CDI0_ARUDO
MNKINKIQLYKNPNAEIVRKYKHKLHRRPRIFNLCHTPRSQS